MLPFYRDWDDYYIRWANAICCWRTEFARGIRYGNLTFSEDTDFGSRASKRHPKEEFVNKVLYKHSWNTEISTGETGQNLAPYEYIECFPNENLTEHLIYAEI